MRIPGESTALLSTDMFAAASELPSHLQTHKQRLVTLVVVSILCGFASGPVGSFPTLEPLLVDDHLFEGNHQQAQLSDVFSVSMGLQVGSSLIVGIWYDRVGPRVSASIGALIAAFGLVGMSAAVQWPASLSWVLYVAYPVANIGGALNTNSLYGFVWLFPARQNMITSLTGAVPALSDSIALVAVELKNVVGLSVFFLVLAFLALGVAVGTWHLVPSREAVLQCAHIVASRDAIGFGEDEDEVSWGGGYDPVKVQVDLGATAADVDETPPVITSPESSWELVRRSLALMRDEARCVVLFVSYAFLYYMVCFYTITTMLYFYTSSLGKANAEWLTAVFAGVYGVAGSVSALCMGHVCDRVGLRKFLNLQLALVMVYATVLCVPTLAAQIVGQVLLTVGLNMYIVLLTRFALLYAPPELFGTYSGLQFSILGLAQLFVTPLTNAVTSATLSGPAQYLAPYLMFATLTLVSGVAMQWHWTKFPPPRVGFVVPQ